MKLHQIFRLLLFISLTAIVSCRDFIEPSINGSHVTLEAPANNYQTPKYTTNFWWDKTDDALNYRLQIVTPRFDSIGNVILDTLIKKNSFTITMDPGNYQWRVQAANGSSKTVYSDARTLVILQSSIKQQTVQLSSPANNTVTNQSKSNFQWGSMYGATKYRLEIDTNNFADTSKLLVKKILPGQQFNYTFVKDQTYQWRVRAENDTAKSKWSAINSITYNHTPPGIVTLISPVNRQTLPLPVALQWNPTTKAVKYKVYVLKSDSTSTYNQSFPAIVNTTNFSFNLGQTGDRVYWKITAIDAAGNEGAPSMLRNFIVQ